MLISTVWRTWQIRRLTRILKQKAARCETAGKLPIENDPRALRLESLLKKHKLLIAKEESLLRHYFPTLPIASWHEYRRDRIIQK